MRNKYKDSYRKTTEIDARGRMVDRYVYAGGYYVLPFDEQKKKNTNLINLGFAAFLAVILLLTGMVNQSSSRTFWVVYPYLFIYLPLIYLIIGVIDYLGCGLHIQIDVYDKSIRRIRHSVWGIIIMSGIAVICDVIYLILFHGHIELARELIYLAGLVFLVVTGVCYGICYDRMFAGIILET